MALGCIVGLGVTGVTLGKWAMVGNGDGVGGIALVIYSHPASSSTSSEISSA
jgi:hypothetical protein